MIFLFVFPFHSLLTLGSTSPSPPPLPPPPPDLFSQVWYILEKTTYGEQEDEVGISRLVQDGSFTAAFPLHDVSSINYRHACRTEMHAVPSSGSYILLTIVASASVL